MRMLGLIPARGGSKGVPGKNRKVLAGKPLLVHTIEAALKSKKLTDVVFTSEDETLNTLAKEAGAEVPFIRPEVLATDSASSIDVVLHALAELKKLGKEYDAVCLLQVTNPFRSAAFIDQAITKFEDANCDALVSVLPVPHEYNPYWVYKENDKGALELYTGEKEIIKRRQDLPTAYHRDGAIYITTSEILIQQKSFYGNSLSYILSDPERHINIDTPEDWEAAVVLAKKLHL
ncbi:MAG: CMP-N,N'-diacetyllegionaminic acid synthase [Planctomycetota bacterium]|jgi:CMP-N,N'-diacetyllegionaminic acid synthase|uniref:acylneuraminate cytidylyltransferase family protein n=1 Tax=Patiriisocius sp. Uisw_047 TaxID=3230969 RepID=UPI0039E87944